MEGVANLDLLAVGIAIAGILILGVIVFFSNRKSITNRTFLFFSIAGSLWGVFNYSYYQFSNPELVLWLLRIHAFFAVWYVFFTYKIFYVFPREKVEFPRFYKSLVVPWTVLVSFLTLTPWVFSRITKFSLEGRIESVENGPGIFLFGATVIGLILSGPFLAVKKRGKATGLERTQFSFILLGTLITFSLHIIYNFIFPAFLDDPRFIQFGGVFVFPIIAFTSYAIFKHHLLNIKVIATEILAFVLAVVSLFEVIISRNLGTIIFRSGIFVLVLGFGILLIKSVLKEVEQREELERLNKILAEEKAKVEELSHFKTQLLSLASHQVKSPLAAIKGFVSILLEGLYGPVKGKVRETLEKVKHSSDSLIELVNTLLSVRQIEEGRMDFSFEKVKFHDIVKEVVDELQPLAKTKNLEFTFSSSSDAFVNADPQKLRQVVQNLVDNAIKYTPTGSVRVELREDPGGWVTVTVTDSGLGISKKLLPELFEEFIRDERVKKEIRGTGLGLFIARKIVEAHGGTITAASEGEGKGSTFIVKLRKT